MLKKDAIEEQMDYVVRDVCQILCQI